MEISKIQNAVELPKLLAEQMKCAICLNLYMEPVELKCKHVFCQHCLEAYMKQEPRNRMVSCPECRRETKKSKVKRNFKFAEICDTLRAYSGQHSDSVCGEAKLHQKYNAESVDENHKNLRPPLKPSYCGQIGAYAYPEPTAPSAPPSEPCLTIEKSHSIQCNTYNSFRSSPRGVALIGQKPVLVFENTIQKVDSKTGKLVQWQWDSVSEIINKASACETFGSGSEMQFIVACDDLNYGLMVFNNRGRFDRFLRTRFNENPRTCCIAKVSNRVFALNHIKGRVCSFILDYKGGSPKIYKDISLCHQTSAQDTMAIVNNTLHIMCTKEGRIHRYDFKGNQLTPMRIPLHSSSKNFDACPPKICSFQDKYLVIAAENRLRIVDVETEQCVCEQVSGKLSGIVDVTCDERHVVVLHHVTRDSCRVTTLTCTTN